MRGMSVLRFKKSFEIRIMIEDMDMYMDMGVDTDTDMDMDVWRAVKNYMWKGCV